MCVCVCMLGGWVWAGREHHVCMLGGVQRVLVGRERKGREVRGRRKRGRRGRRGRGRRGRERGGGGNKTQID